MRQARMRVAIVDDEALARGVLRLARAWASAWSKRCSLNGLSR